MIVCVEGNIGSGKSTVLQRLFQRSVVVKEEPVEEWGELLDLYYDNPTQWALPFNLKVLHSFCTIPEAPDDELIVIERSPGACRHVFGQLSYNDEHMSPAAWDVFKEYHEMLMWEPDAYIYIDTSPSRCFDRIHQRDRPCERGLTEDYLRRIEFQYNNFLKFAESPVHIVDGNRDMDRVLEDVLTRLQHIKIDP